MVTPANSDQSDDVNPDDPDGLTVEKSATLLRDLERVLNGHSRENQSNTPDFLLAEYLLACLSAYEVTVRARAGWYGRMDTPGRGPVPYGKDQVSPS